MNIRSKPVVILLILIVPLLLAACGGDDNGSNGDAQGSDLSQTLSGTLEGVTVELNYPDGWVTSSTNEQIALANNQETVELVGNSGAADAAELNVPDDSIGMQVIPFPTGDLPAGMGLMEIAGLFTSEGPAGTTVGELEETNISGQSTVKAALSGSDGLGGEMFLVQFDEAIVIGVALSGSYGDFQDTINAIMNTVSVSVA